MKLSLLILFAVFTFSLPLKAEESETAEESSILTDCLHFFHFGDGDCKEERTSEQIAERIRSQVCPHFLMAQIVERDQKGMFFSMTDVSPDKLCKNDLKDSHFNNTEAFEKYLQNKPPFSNINTNPIADCLSHPFDVEVKSNATSNTIQVQTTRKRTLPEDKHKLVLAEYYLTQHRLESGMSNTLQEITAIDQLIGGDSNLDQIDCNKYQHTPNIFNECQSLQKCSSSEDLLSQSTKDTMKAMLAIQAIDKEIKRSKDVRKNRSANRQKIRELKERKAVFQSLYPWTAGRIFQDEYKENFSEEQTAQLIKKQLSHTRTRLAKNIDEMQETVSCIRYNEDCSEVNFDKVMAKTPALNAKQIFQEDKRKSMSDSQLAELSDEKRKQIKTDFTASSYFNETQCRQQLRENVAEANEDLGYLATDVILTVALVGLGSAAVMGRMAIRAAGQVSKAQRMQNLGLWLIDIGFSAPYINKAINDCDSYMNQLELKASEPTNNICSTLPVQSQLTSDLKSCLLTASLASLPLAVPLTAVAGRAIFKKMAQGKGTTPPSPAEPKGTPPQPEGTPPLQSLTPQNKGNQTLQLQNSSSTTVIPKADTTSSSGGSLQLLSNPTNRLRPAAQRSADTASPSSSLRNGRRQASQTSEQSEAINSRPLSQSNSFSARQSSQRANNRSQSLKDSKNQAEELSNRIVNIIKENRIKQSTSKDSIRAYLQQARIYLKKEHPRLSETEISTKIAQDLQQRGVNATYTNNGAFKIENDEGVFIINSTGKITKILGPNTTRSSNLAGRQNVQQTNPSSTRSGAIGSNQNRTHTASPSPRRQFQSITSQTPRIASRTPRATTHSSQAQPDRVVSRTMLAGNTAKRTGTALMGGGAVSSTGAVADNNVEEEDAGANKNVSAGNMPAVAITDHSMNDRNDNEDDANSGNSRNNNNDDGEDDNKTADLDCSQYKGGAPQNRREMICYHYMRVQQLQEETKSIQQNTQALKNFKNQVWHGIKENQVPPSFFTNNALQQHVQQNKSATVDYLSSFRLMYNISRIQSQHLTANDRNRLKHIIQNTDQYMRSPNLDGYSHIQESVNILMNRLQIPRSNNSFSL